MEISVPLLSALVAALVSLVVGLLTFVATSKSMANQRRMQERELDRRFTQRLYELRLESYPRAFEITDRLSGNLVFNPALRVADLHEVREELTAWYRSKAAFVLSNDAMKSWYAMKGALTRVSQAGDQLTEESRQTIWRAKNSFRAALRADVNLLYVEESSAHAPLSKSAP